MRPCLKSGSSWNGSACASWRLAAWSNWSVAGIEEENYAEGIQDARRLLMLDPWLESAHRNLMWMLARTGDRSGALAQYETCRQVLAQELGVEPVRETTALYEQIKAGAIEPVEGPEHPTPSRIRALRELPPDPGAPQ